MRIGIDMRMGGTGEGIGRYVEELVKHLARIDFRNDYFLVVDKLSDFAAKFSASGGTVPSSPPRAEQFQVIPVSSRYYSWAEQTKLIYELKKLKLDLMHFASFNAPVFYPGKFVVTIHDVIHHLFPGKKKSRLFHRLAYRAAIWSSVARAKRIIAVSEGTKSEITRTFHVSPRKIVVIYEGVDPRYERSTTVEEMSRIALKYRITKPYLLFVGVWRQYKNLPRLAQAFDILKERYEQDLQLVLVGKIDPFYPEIKQAVLSAKYAKDIKALGFVPDSDVPALYQGARVFVLPSLTEGFGLIGVEAQAAGVPVVASAIPVLQEVLGEGAVYFDPKNPAALAEQIHMVLSDSGLTRALATRGRKNAQKYDWQNTAQETLRIYQEAT